MNLVETEFGESTCYSNIALSRADAQDEPNITTTNEEVSTPLLPQQQVTPTNPSTGFPSVAIMVPTTDLVITDPISTMIEYMLSFYTPQVKSQDIDTSTLTRAEVVGNPLYDNLSEMLNQHGDDMLEALTKIPDLKQRFPDLIDEVIEREAGLSVRRKQEF